MAEFKPTTTEFTGAAKAPTMTGKVVDFQTGQPIVETAPSYEELCEKNQDIVLRAITIWGNPSEQQITQLICQTLMQREALAKKSIEPTSASQIIWDGSTTPMQQQHQSGGLLNLSDADRVESRARQQAHIATLQQ